MKNNIYQGNLFVYIATKPMGHFSSLISVLHFLKKQIMNWGVALGRQEMCAFQNQETPCSVRDGGCKERRKKWNGSWRPNVVGKCVLFGTSSVSGFFKNCLKYVKIHRFNIKIEPSGFFWKLICVPYWMINSPWLAPAGSSLRTESPTSGELSQFRTSQDGWQL